MGFKISGVNVTGKFTYSASSAPPAVSSYYVVAAMDDSPYIQAYEWSTETGFGAKYNNPSVLPSRLSSDTISVSPDGKAVAVAGNISTGPQVYSFSTSGFGSLYPAPVTSPQSTQSAIDFSPSGNAIAFTGDSGERIFAYQWSGVSGFGTKYSQPSTAQTLGGREIRFNHAGNKIAVGVITSPFIYIYEWSDSTGFGVRYSNPASLPTGAISRISWTPDDSALGAVRLGSIAYVYAVNEGSWGTRYSFGTGSWQDVEFSNDGNTAFLASSALSTRLAAYPWTGSGIGTKYADPATLPPASYAVNVSPYDGTLAVGSTAATGGAALNAYKWNGNAWGTKYADPSTPAIGIVRSIRFGRIQ